MEIFEQSEFRGLALKGMAQEDPYTSRMELNTETNEDSLNRLKGRQPYIASQFPANAVYFDEHNKMLVAKKYGGSAAAFPYAVGEFNASVCFRWDGAKDFSTVLLTSHTIFGNIELSTYDEWSFNVAYSASKWKAEARFLDSGGGNTKLKPVSATISAGVWYWAELSANASTTCSFSIYKDGSLTPIESLATACLRAATAITGSLCIGGGIEAFNSKQYLYRGAVAYAAVATGVTCQTPWVAKVARNGQDNELDCSFLVQDAGVEAYIGKIATASASAISWCWSINHEITTASVATSIGILAHNSCPIEVNLDSDELFRRKTVFLFDVDGQPEDKNGYFRPLIRSEDSTFKIEGLTSTSYAISLSFNPTTASYGSPGLGCLKTITYSYAASAVLGRRWLAFELTPTLTASVNNVAFYEFTAAAWTSLLAATATTYSQGIIPPESSRYIIGGEGGTDNIIYDFRVSVGDDSWKTNNTPTATTIIPEGTILWLNCAPGIYPKDENVKTLSGGNSGLLSEKTIAISDRIDGSYRYKVSPNRYIPKYTGCQYITNAFLPKVDDIYDAGSGNVSVATDGYLADSSGTSFTCSPTSNSGSKSRRVIHNIGSNRYLCGGGKLQFVGRRSRFAGLDMPACYISPGISTVDDSTLDDRGSLLVDTVYKVKFTLYNAENGDESNPFGMFRFIPHKAASTPATVGYAMKVWFYGSSDISGLHLRAYRYVSGDGEYHLEGSAPFNRVAVNYSTVWANSVNFTFAMDDAALTLQPSLHSDDYHIPEHDYSTIWNNRSFFIDTYNRSRIFYSKEYAVGNVPTTNFLWSDEGLTGEILGLVPGFGGLLVLKERSIWIIPYFATDEEAVCQQLIPDVGVVGGDAAVFVDGILYFASNDGLYIYNGQTTERISQYLNKSELVVWDHDPRSTRAYYDRRNFKVVFWNDGSFVSVDVRSGAIRLGASDDRCVTNISSVAYSGPVYGGTGGVFKEATGNAGLLGSLDDAHSPSLMPEIVSEFGDGDTSEVVNINTATAALVYNADNWYSINGDRASTFDCGSATAGFLTIVLENAAAHTWSSAAAAAPAIARHLNGDFLGMCCRTDLSTVAASQSLIAFSSSDPTKYVKLQCFENSSTSYNIRIEANDAVSTQAINIATIAVTAAPRIALRLYRVGTTFNAGYRYYNGSWGNSMDGNTSITASIGNNVYVGICAEDAVGGRVVQHENRWFYGSNPFSYYALLSSRHPYDDVNGAVYGPVAVTATDYTSAVNWYWTDGNLGTGTKRVGSIFPLWTRKGTWLTHNSMVGRPITQWNTARSDIWSTIIHAVEDGGYGVYYYITKQTDLDEFFIGKRPYYYRGQNIYYGKRADAKMFERLEIINGSDPGGGNADVIFGSQIHGESSVMTASGTIPCTASTNNILPLRIRGNYGYVEIEGYSPLDVSDVKMLRVHYRPVRPRGRVK